MRKQFSVRGGSLMVAFVSSVSLACAQIVPSGVETPTGDVWISDAPYTHWPMSADAELEEEPSWNISPPTNTKVLNADCTVRSQYERRRYISVPLAASLSKGTAKSLARTAGRPHSLRHGLPQDVRLVSFRCRIDAPSSEMGSAP
jgi:hypothetical protein